MTPTDACNRIAELCQANDASANRYGIVTTGEIRAILDKIDEYPSPVYYSDTEQRTLVRALGIALTQGTTIEEHTAMTALFYRIARPEIRQNNT